MVDSQPIRVDPECKRIVEKIIDERRKNGRDKRDVSSARITRAMIRQADFSKRMQEIINADFKD